MQNELNKIIGDKIRMYSLDKNIGRKELSITLGVSQSYISLVEKGERGLSVENLVKLSELFGCSVNSLVGKADVSDSNHREILVKISKLIKEANL